MHKVDLRESRDGVLFWKVVLVPINHYNLELLMVVNSGYKLLLDVGLREAHTPVALLLEDNQQHLLLALLYQLSECRPNSNLDLDLVFFLQHSEHIKVHWRRKSPVCVQVSNIHSLNNGVLGKKSLSNCSFLKSLDPVCKPRGVQLAESPVSLRVHVRESSQSADDPRGHCWPVVWPVLD